MYFLSARIFTGDLSHAVFQPSSVVLGKRTEAIRRPDAFHSQPVVARRLAPAA